MIMKEITAKVNFIKSKFLALQKGSTLNRMRRQATDREKYLQNVYLSVTVTQKICKEHLKFKNKKQLNLKGGQ